MIKKLFVSKSTPPQEDKLDDKETAENKKLNFEVNGVSAKTMALLVALSAGTPALAKGTDSKEKTAVVAEAPEQDNPEKKFFANWAEMTSQGATDTVLSPESIEDLTDVLTIGAPEVFDDERTEQWKREVMENHILKVRNGGNWSFFAAEVNGEKKIFALTVSHVSPTPVGTTTWPGGDLFGFETNGGQVVFEGIGKGIFGPGDPESTTYKFTVLEITRFKLIEYELNDPGADDWKTLRTFPLASEPIDTANPGYIAEFTQSGKPGPGWPDYDPALLDRWVAPVNLDPTGDQDFRTRMIIDQTSGFEGKKMAVPLEIFHEDSLNIGIFSSGGEFGQVVDEGISREEMRQKGDDVELAKDIVEDYRILGPHQMGNVPGSNGVIMTPTITLVQPYRDEIEAAIGGTLLDEAWDLEISGTGVTREVGRVVHH